ncbi:MAG: NAD-dependent epimerase/dehydratase family protein [Chloroflexi bacterium]|nr:NAD-dependent epimerase/dehydratase family protein [Chloroflexota bacterium]
MLESKVLITGASGEIGQALIQSLSDDQQKEIVSLDLKPLPDKLAGKSTHILGNLLEKKTIESLENQHHFSHIFHLAAVLSTAAELNPLLGHQVNTCTTVDLLEMASRQSQKGKESVKFIFPSSIAVYGLPDLDTKNSLPPLKENQWTEPTTMYGCSKLYCEKVGVYYSEYYQQLADQIPVRLDFRAIRFPGIISAFTVPSGGTSDFGPEMIHAAAQGKPYDSFVRPDVRIPFLMMPDAVRSLLLLADAPEKDLSQRVYNITSFNFSAEEFKELTLSGYPEAEIGFNPDPPRQSIVDTWPADIDDSAARTDWGWHPLFDAQTGCREYLIENIAKHYS